MYACPYETYPVRSMRALAALRMVWASAAWMAVEMLATWCALDAVGSRNVGGYSFFRISALYMGPGGEGWGPAFRISLHKNLHPDPVSGNCGRHLRTPPTQPGGSAAGAGLRRPAHAAAAPASVRGSSLCGLRTRTRRGGDDGGARRVETRAPSSPPPVLLGCRPTSPCNALTLPCYRRGDVGDAGGIEPACTDAPDGARPRGGRKDALDTVA